MIANLLVMGTAVLIQIKGGGTGRLYWYATHFSQAVPVASLRGCAARSAANGAGFQASILSCCLPSKRIEAGFHAFIDGLGKGADALEARRTQGMPTSLLRLLEP